MNYPELLTVEQAAEILGIKPRFMREIISKGDIKYVRIGAKTVKITADALMDFINEKTVAPPRKIIDDTKYSGLKSAIKRNRSLKSKDEMVAKKGDHSDGLAEELRDSWR